MFLIITLYGKWYINFITYAQYNKHQFPVKPILEFKLDTFPFDIK